MCEDRDDLLNIVERIQNLEIEDVKQFKEIAKETEEKISQAFANSFQTLSSIDIQLLKEAMAVGTTYYDSTSKKDSENELLLWIELKKNSKKVLRNFTELIDINSQENGRTRIDFEQVKKYLNRFDSDISKIEIYYDEDFTDAVNLPEKCHMHKELNAVFDTAR